MSPPEPVYFREKQRPRWWVYLLVTGLALVVAYLTFNTGQSGIILIVAWALGMVGLPLLVFTVRLVIELRGDRLIVELAPVWTREVPLAEIEDVDAVAVRPLTHPLGWGIRYSPKLKRWAYTVKGKEGVVLKLTGKRPLFVGSQRAQELADAIDAVREGRV